MTVSMHQLDLPPFEADYSMVFVVSERFSNNLIERGLPESECDATIPLYTGLDDDLTTQQANRYKVIL